MPAISLCLCLLLIAYLLVRDCRRRPSVSNAVWIPIVFFLIIGSRPLSMWITSQSYEVAEMGNDAARSPIDQMFYFVTLVSAFVVASRRGVKWAKVASANIPIVSFYLYFIASVSWSGDPSGSLKRIVKDVSLLFIVSLIYSEKEPLQAIGAVYVRCASILLPLSVVFYKYFPQYSRSYAIDGEIMQTGVCTSKNTLGELIMVLMSFLIWDYLQNQGGASVLRRWRTSWSYILLLCLGAGMLSISKSKTALVCTCICILFIVKSSWFSSKAFSRTVFAVALSFPIFLFSTQEFTSVIAPLLRALGRDATFTGRANIWQHITAATVNPLVGAGYWNFWGGPGGYAISKAMDTPIPNGHCGYLDIYLDGGMIGLVFLFVLLVTCGNKIIRKLGTGSNATRRFGINLAYLVALITYNLTESSFARMSILWFTALLMVVEVPYSAYAAKLRPSYLRRQGRNGSESRDDRWSSRPVDRSQSHVVTGECR